MRESLDLATVLFLQKTAYFAGAFALLYVRARSARGFGAVFIAGSFVIQAAGSTLAGYAEILPTYYGTLSLVDLSLGVLGYTMLSVGLWTMSDEAPRAWRALVTLPVVVVLAAGLLTGFHENNAVRAAVFNGFAGVSLMIAARKIHRDGDREALPIRPFLAALPAATAVLYLILAGEFLFNDFAIVSPVGAFSMIIVSVFLLSLFVVILAMERGDVELERLAHTDSLTGIRNRRGFFESVPDVLAEGDAVVLFDVDHFKRLNDRRGHAFGDRVLSEVSRRIEGELRSGDVFARYGGEEFALFLPGAGGEKAVQIADRLREAVSKTTFVEDADEAAVTISGGVAVRRDEQATLRALLSEADHALYEAKAAGRNRIVPFTPDEKPPQAL